MREGNLEAPTRHPLDWRSEAFYDEARAFAELERVFDICHGCRRCVNLCTAFPTLFDLVDASSTLEVDGVAKQDYWKVVDQCYLCDTCYMTKCPYVPPHPWNVDFPHLMLRAKAIKFRKGKVGLRDKLLSSTDAMGRLSTIPVVVQMVNAANRNGLARNILHKTLGVHEERELPEYASRKFRANALQSKKHEILERVEHRVLHRLHTGVVREHQRQLLLEHQRAGGDRREDRVSGAGEFRHSRNIFFF